MKKKKKGLIIVFIVIILFIIILGLGAYGYYTVLNTELLYEGIIVDGMDISLMTKEDALDLIKNKNEKELDNKNMKIYGDNREYNINLRELGYYYDYNKAIDKAYSIGREGNIINRVKEIISVKKTGVSIPLDAHYDRTKIDSIVNEIAEEINVEMADAQFNFNNGKITVTEETIGKKVNEEELTRLINSNINDLSPIEIPIEKIMPSRTKELLGRINGVIGEFSTSFKGSTKERIENIRLSSKSLSKDIIMPGETVSFNNTTGPRSKAAGYKEANVIFKGEFVPDTGGGVCQTSTTLYNALLRADLTILERSHHSIPIKYVPLGQDAAVAYGVLDLKFRNDFDFPIYIDSKIIGDRIHIYIYGDKNVKNYNVSLDSEIIEEILPEEEIVVDKSLKPGTKEVFQEGRTGYKVNTYKSIIKNGKVVNRTLITKDFYKPRKHIYIIGEGTSEEVNNTEDTEEDNED